MSFGEGIFRVSRLRVSRDEARGEEMEGSTL